MRNAMSEVFNLIGDDDVCMEITRKAVIAELNEKHKKERMGWRAVECGNEKRWWEHPEYNPCDYYIDKSGVSTRYNSNRKISIPRAWGEVGATNKWINYDEYELWYNVRNHLVLSLNKDSKSNGFNSLNCPALDYYSINHKNYVNACNLDWDMVSRFLNMLKESKYNRYDFHIVHHWRLTEDLCRKNHRLKHLVEQAIAV